MGVMLVQTFVGLDCMWASTSKIGDSLTVPCSIDGSLCACVYVGFAAYLRLRTFTVSARSCGLSTVGLSQVLLQAQSSFTCVIGFIGVMLCCFLT